mgnify:FL=1
MGKVSVAAEATQHIQSSRWNGRGIRPDRSAREPPACFDAGFSEISADGFELQGSYGPIGRGGNDRTSRRDVRTGGPLRRDLQKTQPAAVKSPQEVCPDCGLSFGCGAGCAERLARSGVRLSARFGTSCGTIPAGCGRIAKRGAAVGTFRGRQSVTVRRKRASG